MSLQEQLFAAAKAGNHLEIRRWMGLRNRNFQDLRDNNGHSLLHITSSNAHNVATEFLLNEGFDVNHRASNGNTPLHYAVMSGSYPLTNLLLRRGAFPDETSQDGYRPIHLAVMLKNDFIVKLLLLAEVKLDSRLMELAAENSNERIISMIGEKQTEINLNLIGAIRRGEENEAEKYFYLGADPTFVNNGWSAISIAAYLGQNSLLEKFMKVPNILNHYDPNDFTPLDAAISGLKPKTLEVLLQHGYDPNEQRGNYPLHRAVYMDNALLVRILLQYKANTNAEGIDGRRSIHIALEQENNEIIDLLFKHGAHIKKEDKLLWGILHQKKNKFLLNKFKRRVQGLCASLIKAAKDGNIDKLQISLNQGADPLFKNKAGWTALHWAVKNGHIDAIRLLSKYCADLKNGCNESALYLAVVNNRLDAVDVLYNNACDMNAKNGPKDNTALHQAVASKNNEMMKKLLECRVQTDVLNNEGEAALHIAVKIGNPQIIDQFMLCNEHKTIDFNIKTNNGCTPLYFAALEDKLWITTKLIEAGCDVNATNGENKRTALHIAVQERNTEIVGALLERKADITLLDNDGYSALHNAVLKGYADVVDKFICARANLDVLDKYGKSPLHIAVEKQHFEIIEKLLKADVNICLKTCAGKTTLDLAMATCNDDIIDIITKEATNLDGKLVDAIKAGNVDSVTRLLKVGASLSTKGQDNCYPIHRVAQMGNLTMINILLQARADVNVKNSRGETPLILAAINNHLGVVTALSIAGSDMNAASGENHWSALHFAVYNGNEEIASELLEKNCKELIRDKNGDCPIHLAAYFGNANVIKAFKSLDLKSSDKETPLYLAVNGKHYQTVKELLKYGCDKNARNGDPESTALHRAVAIEDEILVKMLLEHKVDDALMDKNGLTALHLAVTKNKPNMIKAFKNSNLNVKNPAKITPLYMAVQKDHRDVALELIKLGCDINAKNCNEGFTALHQAFLSNNMKIMEILLKYKANMMIRDKNGFIVLHKAAEKGRNFMIEYFEGDNIDIKNVQDETPLYLAVRNYHLGTAYLLIRRGSNINVKNGIDQYTVLHEAVRQGNEEISEILLAAHPDTSLLDKKGFTPLHYAIMQGNIAIVKMFISKNIGLNNKNMDGNTPLHDAVKYKKVSIVKALLNSKADQRLFNADGHCPLHIAVDEEQIIDCFIKNNAQLSLLTRDGGTVLQMAMTRHKDDLNKFKSLIKVCGIDMKDRKGCTLLYHAVRGKKVNVVKMLLELGASDRCEDDEEQNILIYAIDAKNIEMVDIFYARRAFSETDKILPLQKAVQNNDIKIVKTLLEKGYNVNLTNYQNKHALHVAIENDNVAIVEFLLRRGASVYHKDTGNVNVLHYVALNGNEDIYDILKNYTNLNEMNTSTNKGEAPLYLAVNKGHLNIVKKILDDLGKANLIQGAINATYGNKSQTILHTAVIIQNVKIVELLLSYVPCLSTQDSEGNTALHCAVLYTNLEIVEKLLLKSAKEVYVKNSEGETPLEIAKYGKSITIWNRVQIEKLDKIIAAMNYHTSWISKFFWRT